MVNTILRLKKVSKSPLSLNNAGPTMVMKGRKLITENPRTKLTWNLSSIMKIMRTFETRIGNKNIEINIKSLSRFMVSTLSDISF